MTQFSPRPTRVLRRPSEGPGLRAVKRTAHPVGCITLCRACLVAGLLATGFLSVPARGAEGDLRPQGPSFLRDIRPILADKCYPCHGPDDATRQGGLRLDDPESAFGLADSGLQAIVAGHPAESELMVRVTTADESLQMPPVDADKQLTAAEIALLRHWIAAGASWERHWAFVRPQRPPLPAATDPRHAPWPLTPIDHFVLATLEQEGLTPAPAADRATLLRRVSLDLTGLPPLPEEIDAFLSDPHPEAYPRAVDRLLASSRYAEHMARFWLDAARYADTHGLHLDNYREMWLYRDWVIDAFRTNKPFDAFVIEQLAGDLLPEPTPEQLTATGFNRCHVTTNEGGSIEEEVYVRNVVERVVNVGTVFLGLTLDCTRCHDHKYDPLSQNDFYSLFAYFNSLDGPALDGNRKDHEPVLRVPTEDQHQRKAVLQAEIAELEQQLAAAKAEKEAAEKEAAAQAAAAQAATEKVATEKVATGPLSAVSPAESPAEPATAPAEPATAPAEPATDPADPRREALTAKQKELAALEAAVATTLIWREKAEPRPAYVLLRGEYDQRGAERPRATPRVLPPLAPDAPHDRLGLARWLTTPAHPLTARVTVNRLWQQFFGTGLVKTSDDFGTRSDPPSHPELLDWLAVDFVESGWDLRAAVRQIVCSATYRQSAAASPEAYRQDPENRLLARGPRFRLDAEVLRDQALAISGLLVEQVGGPSVKPPQPDGLWFAVGYSGSNTVRFAADSGSDKVHRRSLYTFIKRTAPPPQLSTFDAPSREATCVRRDRTNTPLQALLLMNDPQYMEAAQSLARRVIREEPLHLERRAERLIRLAVGRNPGAAETADVLQGVLEDQRYFQARPELARQAAGSAEQQAEQDTAAHPQAAELAAWTMASNLILSWDEVLTKP